MNPSINDHTANVASEVHLPQEERLQTMQSVDFPVMQGMPPAINAPMGYSSAPVMQPVFPEAAPAIGRTAGTKKKSDRKGRT